MQVSESDLFDEDDMGSEAGDMGGSEAGEDAGDMQSDLQSDMQSDLQSDMASEAQRPVHVCTHVWGLCMYMYARICGGGCICRRICHPRRPTAWAWELLRSSRANGP